MDPKASMIDKQMNTLAPYILQIAIGIHAVFEGLAIGIENEVSTCIGISAAVVCHKWVMIAHHCRLKV
jgi:zinc transporter 1/2/3